MSLEWQCSSAIRLLNVTQVAGTNYNWQIPAPTYNQLTQQPAVRLDYQMTQKVRVTGKYSGQRARSMDTPGLIPGFSDVFVPHPFITNYGVTVDYSVTPTTFLEATYGQIKNELAGGNEGGILYDDESNRNKSLANFPILYPQAGVLDQRYYANKIMQETTPPFWDGKSLNLPPTFGWGSHIGASPTQQRFPGFLNINHTQDVAFNMTHVMSRHTISGGAYSPTTATKRRISAPAASRTLPSRGMSISATTPTTLSIAASAMRTQRRESSRSTCSSRSSSKPTWFITSLSSSSRTPGR